MKKVVLIGDVSEVNKVMRENRLRVERGLIEFLEESEMEESEIKLGKRGRKPKDTKEVSEVEGKEIVDM